MLSSVLFMVLVVVVSTITAAGVTLIVTLFVAPPVLRKYDDEAQEDTNTP